jgi:hypothetical protein
LNLIFLRLTALGYKERTGVAFPRCPQHCEANKISMAQVIEILLYTLKPGTGREFYEIMQDESVPLHKRNGIDVVWHGQSMHNADVYGLIRAFADVATLEAQLANFYASEAWRSGPRVAIIERIETTTKIVVPMNDGALEGLRGEVLPSNAVERTKAWSGQGLFNDTPVHFAQHGDRES